MNHVGFMAPCTLRGAGRTFVYNKLGGRDSNPDYKGQNLASYR